MVISSDEEEEQKSLSPKKEEPFDLVTKTTGSINAKVLERQRKLIERERLRAEKKKMHMNRSLVDLENEVEMLLLKETLVILSQEFIDRMRTHYNVVLEEEMQELARNGNEEGMSQQSTDKVNLNNLIGSIAEDDYFQDQMNEIVRESVDGERENFEALLNRILNDFKKPQISWL